MGKSTGKGTSTKNVGRGQKGPAGEVHSGNAKVNKTIAGRKNNQVQKASGGASKVPGAVKG